MRILPRPNLNPADLYDACTSGVGDAALRAELEHVRHKVMEMADDYLQNALVATLHRMQGCDHGKPEQIIVGTVFKKSLNDLYSVQMVGKQGPGRNAYEQMLAAAPLRKCPYCGLGQVSTLDHVLSKSRYPAFSVLPDNLVPACSDCNKSKGGGLTTEANMALHPYFEQDLLNQITWLHAEALYSEPVAIHFSVNVPQDFSPAIRSRLINHFDSLGLALRYSTEAASELVSIQNILKGLHQPTQRYERLLERALSETELNRNSWQAATYTALLGAPWFWAA